MFHRKGTETTNVSPTQYGPHKNAIAKGALSTVASTNYFLSSLKSKSNLDLICQLYPRPKRPQPKHELVNDRGLAWVQTRANFKGYPINSTEEQGLCCVFCDTLLICSLPHYCKHTGQQAITYIIIPAYSIHIHYTYTLSQHTVLGFAANSVVKVRSFSALASSKHLP